MRVDRYTENLVPQNLADEAILTKCRIVRSVTPDTCLVPCIPTSLECGREYTILGSPDTKVKWGRRNIIIISHIGEEGHSTMRLECDQKTGEWVNVGVLGPKFNINLDKRTIMPVGGQRELEAVNKEYESIQAMGLY